MVRSSVKLDRVEASSLSCARAGGVQFRSTSRALEFTADREAGCDCGAAALEPADTCAKVNVQPIAALKATIPKRQKAFMFQLDPERENKSRRNYWQLQKRFEPVNWSGRFVNLG
jgi:hypothetical protein